MQANNRAKAWFEIRYGSNGGASEATVGPGLAKRRYLESQMFGLYDDANNVGTVEAKAVFQMLQDKRDKIIAYEAKYGRLPDGRTASRLTGDGRVPLDAANADYATAGILGDTQSIPGSAQSISLIDISLNPAKIALLSDLRTSNPDLATKLQDDQWISTNIYLNGDTGGSMDSLAFQTGNFLEMRIPRSEIGDPSSLKIHVSMVNEMPAGNFTFAGAPSTSFTDAVDPDYAKYFALDLTGSTLPTAHAPLP